MQGRTVGVVAIAGQQPVCTLHLHQSPSLASPHRWGRTPHTHTGPPHTVPSVLGVMLEIAQHTWERALEPWLRRWQGCVRSSPVVRTHGRTLRFAQSVTAPESAGMQVCRAGLRWSVCSGGALGLFLLLISSAITTLYRSAPAGPLSPPPSPPASPKV